MFVTFARFSKIFETKQKIQEMGREREQKNWKQCLIFPLLGCSAQPHDLCLIRSLIALMTLLYSLMKSFAEALLLNWKVGLPVLG